MSYRTILCAVSNPQTAPHIDAAIDLARAEDAHLSVLGLGIDTNMSGFYFDAGSAVLQRDAIERAQADAVECAQAMRARLLREDIRWSVDAAIAQVGSLAAILGGAARFADLVVAPKPYGPGAAPGDEAVIEAALFQGGAPVLVLPAQTRAPTRPERIALAWNQGKEALAAARAALPLLRRAELVNIAVVDPSGWMDRDDPAGALAEWLGRHGVRTEVSVLAKTAPISDVIAQHARETGADLLVMGAYGHSRLREAILGGATRSMLEKATLPVLMAH